MSPCPDIYVDIRYCVSYGNVKKHYKPFFPGIEGQGWIRLTRTWNERFVFRSHDHRGAQSQEDFDVKWHDGSANRKLGMNTFKDVIVTVIPSREIPSSLPRSQIYTHPVYIPYTYEEYVERRCIIAFQSWYIVHRVSNERRAQPLALYYDYEQFSVN